MKHNLILSLSCSGLSVLATIFEFISGGRDFTCAVILLVATMYFAGRHMDEHDD